MNRSLRTRSSAERALSRSRGDCGAAGCPGAEAVTGLFAAAAAMLERDFPAGFCSLTAEGVSEREAAGWPRLALRESSAEGCESTENAPARSNAAVAPPRQSGLDRRQALMLDRIVRRLLRDDNVMGMVLPHRSG